MTAETQPSPAETEEQPSRVRGWTAAPAAVVMTGVVLGVIIIYAYFVADKTLWDLLELLIVPAALLIGGYLLNQALREREREAEQAQERERESAEQAQRERELEVERQRAQDEALQAYLDQISDMLIPTKDQPSLSHKDPPDSLKTVARARTLTVLPRLDVERKKRVVQFLYESNLIARDRAVLDLSGASLSGVDLRGFDLSKADLRGADLRDVDLRSTSVHYRLRAQKRSGGTTVFTSPANLSEANLRGADLRGVNMPDEDDRGNAGTALRGADLYDAKLDFANLSGAKLGGADLRRGAMFGTNLRHADLSGADLSGVDLSNTHLSGADLRHADLRHADLSGVDLSGVRGITNEELERQARSLTDATMPDGQKYEDWLNSKGREEDGADSAS